MRKSSAARALKAPSPTGPAGRPKLVGAEPSKTPGLPGRSVSVTVSVSPVRRFSTCACSVPKPARSPSVTVKVTGVPTVVASIETRAGVPFLTGSVSERIWLVVPFSRSASR